MFWAWRPDRANGTWVAKPYLTEWGHQIHIWDFSAGGYTLALSCWSDSQLIVESVNTYLFIKEPTAAVVTAASLLMWLPLSQHINMDTDGIKQNVTQTSLQPPGLLNLNVWLLVGPKITQVQPDLVLSQESMLQVHLAAVRILFPCLTAAVATSSLPGFIIQ